MNAANRDEGITLRQAALIAGFGYLLSPVSYAEFTIMPKLVIAGNIEQTVQNITAHRGMFLAAIFCYLITFLEDVVIAWALYYLLAPVNSSVCIAHRVVPADVYRRRSLRVAQPGHRFPAAEHARLPHAFWRRPAPRPRAVAARFCFATIGP